MSQFSKVPDLSIDDYLAQEETAGIRHEYVKGQIFAMSGATEAHNVICGNVFALLHGHLKNSGCRAFMNDMKVSVQQVESFYYPDVMVTCEPYDGKSVFKQAPSLIIEVLSPSTTHIDRREKLIAYRQLKSLKQYVIVHQNKYKIDVYQLAADGHWEVISLTIGDLLVMNPSSPALEVKVSEIYEGVVLDLTVEEDCEDDEAYGF